MPTYQHREAFALMWYACACGHHERIWNSRDGVTPFGGVLCTSCGGRGMQTRGLKHIEWELDQRAPDHRLVDGQRFFRDGTAADAARIIERRIAHFATCSPIPLDVQRALRRDALEQAGEWRQGWPFLDRYAEPRS